MQLTFINGSGSREDFCWAWVRLPLALLNSFWFCSSWGGGGGGDGERSWQALRGVTTQLDPPSLPSHAGWCVRRQSEKHVFIYLKFAPGPCCRPPSCVWSGSPEPSCCMSPSPRRALFDAFTNTHSISHISLTRLFLFSCYRSVFHSVPQSLCSFTFSQGLPLSLFVFYSTLSSPGHKAALHFFLFFLFLDVHRSLQHNRFLLLYCHLLSPSRFNNFSTLFKVSQSLLPTIHLSSVILSFPPPLLFRMITFPNVTSWCQFSGKCESLVEFSFIFCGTRQCYWGVRGRGIQSYSCSSSKSMQMFLFYAFTVGTLHFLKLSYTYRHHLKTMRACAGFLFFESTGNKIRTVFSCGQVTQW